MLSSSSNFSRGSSRRKRQTANRSAGSTTTNGSIASSLTDLILSPNFCWRAEAISLGVTGSRLRRFGLFLGLDRELVRPLRRADLVGQGHPAGPARNGHVHRLGLGQVLHAADLVLD